MNLDKRKQNKKWEINFSKVTKQRKRY